MKTQVQKSAIGLIGLATMGANLARNIASKGFQISVFNRTTEKTAKFTEEFSTKYPSKTSPSNSLLIGSPTLKEFVSSLASPRKIILLVKAGQPVDDIITELSPLLDKNDIIIDCGNSHFKDTERRQNELAKLGLNFIGCGISGGEEGALHGPSLMPGGNKEAWKKIEKIFMAVAADVPVEKNSLPKKSFTGDTFHLQNSKCVSYIGENGSGHFVKMVHNGIEYAIMQLIAESYDILKNIGKFSNPELAKIFSNYNKNPNLKSFLIEITAKILMKKLEKPNFNRSVLKGTRGLKFSDNAVDVSLNGFLLNYIKDSAAQKGTGKWTTEIAHDLGAYIPTINAAVDARIVSGETSSREMCQKFFTLKISKTKLSPLAKKQLINQVENALELAIILCYEQGVGLLSKANKEYNWNLNFAEITRIWQGGCIIRSGYLKDLTTAFGSDKKAAGTVFQKIMKTLGSEKQKSWRKLLSLALESAIPIPAFYATLSYYDSYAAPHLPQNLIQAQRDFFGAHGYERTDKNGSFHTEW